jgi:mono/diheme cytochrome c family protein
MITYLRSVPPRRTGADIVDSVRPERLSQAEAITGNGARLFAGACIGCHLLNGQGRQVPYAALWGARSVGVTNGHNLVRIMLHGSVLDTPQGHIAMTQFGDEYSDQDIADIANYVIAHYGDRVGRVNAHAVEEARQGSG